MAFSHPMQRHWATRSHFTFEHCCDWGSLARPSEVSELVRRRSGLSTVGRTGLSGGAECGVFSSFMSPKFTAAGMPELETTEHEAKDEDLPFGVTKLPDRTTSRFPTDSVMHESRRKKWFSRSWANAYTNSITILCLK